MFRRLLQVSRGNSFFLFGARGTGKTTYIGEAFDPDASLYLDLLDPEVEDRYRRSPGRLENEVRALPATVEWILIDEVQRAPRLLDVVHRFCIWRDTDTRIGGCSTCRPGPGSRSIW